MKWNKSVAVVITLCTLTACGAGNNDNALGERNDMNNIDPVRNEGTIEAPLQNRGSQQSQNGRTTYDGTYERDNDLTADPIENNQDRMQSEQNYDISKKAAKQISKKMKEIDQAYVLKMGNRAYVAAKLDDESNNRDSNKIDETVKKEIAKIVKSSEEGIDYVYVSTNPDFVNLTTDYANDIENGEPIEGFFNEMGQMIKRIFPEEQE